MAGEEKKVQTAFRLPMAVMSRIDRTVETEQKAAGSVRKVTRSELVRELLTEALDAREKKLARRKKKPDEGKAA